MEGEVISDLQGIGVIHWCDHVHASPWKSFSLWRLPDTEGVIARSQWQSGIYWNELDSTHVVKRIYGQEFDTP